MAVTDGSRITGEKVGKTALEVHAVDEAKVEDEIVGSGVEKRVGETVALGKKEETAPGGNSPVTAESSIIWSSGGWLGCVGMANGLVVAVGAGIEELRTVCLDDEVPGDVSLSGLDLMSLASELAISLGSLTLIVEGGGTEGGEADLCVGMCDGERSALSSKGSSGPKSLVDKSETDCSCGRAGSSIVPFALIFWALSGFSHPDCGSMRYQKRRTHSNPSGPPILGLCQARCASLSVSNSKKTFPSTSS